MTCWQVSIPDKKMNIKMRKITDEINEAKKIENREERIKAVEAVGIKGRAAAQIAYLITIISLGGDDDTGKNIALDDTCDEIEIYGKTYEAKDRIKDADFEWRAAAKVWRKKNA